MAWSNPSTTAPTDYGQVAITPGAAITLVGVAIWAMIIWLVNDDDSEQIVRIVDGSNILHPGKAIPVKDAMPLEIPFLPCAGIQVTLITPPSTIASTGVYGRVVGYPQ